jgi:hypothetical protein
VRSNPAEAGADNKHVCHYPEKMDIHPTNMLPEARSQELLRQMEEEKAVHSYNSFSFILQFMYLADKLHVSKEQILQAGHANGLPRIEFEAQLYQLSANGYLQQEFATSGSFFRMIGRGRKMYEDILPKSTSDREPEKREVSSKLIELKCKLADPEQMIFLDEAITCLRAGAYRAAVVMGWNLAYDHVRRWVFKNHLPAFNAELTSRRNRHGAALRRGEDTHRFPGFRVASSRRGFQGWPF